jgi:hypothetical protein
MLFGKIHVNVLHCENYADRIMTTLRRRLWVVNQVTYRVDISRRAVGAGGGGGE